MISRKPWKIYTRKSIAFWKFVYPRRYRRSPQWGRTVETSQTKKIARAKVLRQMTLWCSVASSCNAEVYSSLAKTDEEWRARSQVYQIIEMERAISLASSLPHYLSPTESITQLRSRPLKKSIYLFFHFYQGAIAPRTPQPAHPGNISTSHQKYMDWRSIYGHSSGNIWSNIRTVRSIYDLPRGNRAEDFKMNLFDENIFFQMSISTVSMLPRLKIWRKNKHIYIYIYIYSSEAAITNRLRG